MCPLRFRSGIFTSAVVNNIDHNHSSTTTHFIELQYLSFNIPIILLRATKGGSVVLGEATGLKTIRDLPSSYTDVSSVSSINAEYKWLNYTRKTLQ